MSLKKRIILIYSFICFIIVAFYYEKQLISSDFTLHIERQDNLHLQSKNIARLIPELKYFTRIKDKDVRLETKIKIIDLLNNIDDQFSLHTNPLNNQYSRAWNSTMKPLAEMVLDIEGEEVDIMPLEKFVKEFEAYELKLKQDLHIKFDQKIQRYKIFDALVIFFSVGVLLYITHFALKVIRNLHLLKQNIIQATETNDYNGDEDEILVALKTVETLTASIIAEKQNKEIVLNSINDIVLSIDKNKTIVDINLQVEPLLNLSRSEIIGKSLYLLFSTEKHILDRYLDLYLTKQTQIKDLQLYLKTESQKPLSVFVSFSHYTSPQNEVITLITLKDARDSELLKELNLKTKQLVESQKLASLGEVAGGIAHEINNPLSIVKGRVNILENEISKIDSGRFIDHFTSVYKSINRIEKIVRSVRHFAGGGQDVEKTIETVQDIVESALQFIESKLSKNIDLVVDITHPEILVDINMTDISQVLANLISNAVDALDDSQQKTKTIRIFTEEVNNEVYIAVQDNGPGIPEELRHKVMEPFFTTKSSGKGTGMGLSICHGLAKRNNAHLYLDEDQILTTFVLKIKISNFISQRVC